MMGSKSRKSTFIFTSLEKQKENCNQSQLLYDTRCGSHTKLQTLVDTMCSCVQHVNIKTMPTSTTGNAGTNLSLL